MARPRTINDDVVFEALVSATAERGYPPSLRQLAARVGFASASTLYPYLEALRVKGLVTWVPGEFRTLQVVAGNHDVDGGPVAG